MTYPEACLYLGKTPTFYRRSIMMHGSSTRIFTPKVSTPPELIWVKNASAFVDRFQQSLWSQQGEVARSFLHDKGLSDKSIMVAGLGWNESDIYLEREDWGLSPIINALNRPTRLWMPRGLVIPCSVNGEIIRLRIRRHATSSGQRYILIPGSSMRPMFWSAGKKIIIVVESELDGLLLFQEAGDLIDVVAIGSAQARPDSSVHEILQKTEKILVSLDTDDAGAKAAWRFWPETYGRKVVRWPCIKGKDPSEAWQNGLNIRAWVMAGINSH
jgi:hypothetical protein